MFLRNKQLIFFLVWLLLILTPVISVIRNTSFDKTFFNPIVLTNVFQRITGLLAFTLIFIQITLGSFMDRWVQIIGARAYKLHLTQGLVAYGLMFVHPLFQNAIVYQVSQNISSALLVFVPSLRTQTDILLVFGRSAFILATIAVVAAYFRTKPFFRRNWRAFHILNYLVFFLVFFHARIGTDLATFPFSFVYWASTFSVTGTLIYKFLYPVFRKAILIKTTVKEEIPKN